LTCPNDEIFGQISNVRFESNIEEDQTVLATLPKTFQLSRHTKSTQLIGDDIPLYIYTRFEKKVPITNVKSQKRKEKDVKIMEQSNSNNSNKEIYQIDAIKLNSLKHNQTCQTQNQTQNQNQNQNIQEEIPTPTNSELEEVYVVENLVQELDRLIGIATKSIGKLFNQISNQAGKVERLSLLAESNSMVLKSFQKILEIPEKEK